MWGDLADDEALCELVRGAIYVFHCAALVTQASYDEAYAANVEGTRRLARVAAAAGCQRFIHVSSVAVYSHTDAANDYTEDLALSDDPEIAVYARTKFQSEVVLQQAAVEHGMEYTILRPTCIYGPNTKSYTAVPVELIRKGMPVLIGSGEGLLDAVYVDDVAAALVLAAHAPQAAGEVFNIGHELVTFQEFYAYYGRMLNRPLRRLSISTLKRLARVLDATSRAKRIRSGLNFLLRSAENTKQFPSTKAERLLGYVPTVTLPIGMLKTEIWAEQQRLIPDTPKSLDFYGPLPFRPAAFAQPAHEDELVRLIQCARDTKVKVKPIGSLHSQCPIPSTDGICVLMDRHNKLLNVDGGFVTVQAGIKLRELNRLLATHDLALPTLGAIAEQTVSGAISTATHGGSLYRGSLSDCVERLRLVRADGSAVELDSSHKWFPAAAVSMGMLGIISTVTLRCVPSFQLQSRSLTMQASEAFEQFDSVNRNNLFLDMLYFAATDHVEMLAINPVDGHYDSETGPKREPVRHSPKNRSRLMQRVKISGLQGAAWLLRREIHLQRYLTRRFAGSSYRPCHGRSDLVLAFGDHEGAERTPGLVGDMEVAIPYERAAEALHLLRDYFRTTKTFPLLPVHIRASARSDAWLSPAYQRDVCWLEFCSYPQSDTLFEQVHQVLAPLGYRCHWGKATVAGRDYLQSQYPKWDDFVQLRQAWDPQGMFLNSYLEPFFAG